MPLAIKGGRIIYLAHPRKTAGNSLMTTLRKDGWRIAWRATGPIKSHAIASEYQATIERECPWKPQHYYVLTRHPERRLSSLYRYFHGYRHIAHDTYQAWLDHQLTNPHERTYDHSGGSYLSRLVDYVPRDQPWTELRYETGVDTLPSVIAPGLEHDGSRKEPAPEPRPGQMYLDAATRRRLLDWFAPDFERFGYQAEEWAA